MCNDCPLPERADIQTEIRGVIDMRASIYIAVDLQSSEPVNYVGVHPIAWHRRPDQPDIGFREVTDDDLRLLAKLMTKSPGAAPTSLLGDVMAGLESWERYYG